MKHKDYLYINDHDFDGAGEPAAREKILLEVARGIHASRKTLPGWRDEDQLFYGV